MRKTSGSGGEPELVLEKSTRSASPAAKLDTLAFVTYEAACPWSVREPFALLIEGLPWLVIGL